MGTNHKVAFKSEETIASIAARCWSLFPPQKRPFTFDVFGFLNFVLIAKGIDSVVTTRGRKKGKLAIKFFDREFDQDDPAYVKFARDQRDNYVTLYVDRRIWNLAENGDSYASEILAHEIGHILLHDHYANAFSTDGSEQKLFAGTTKEDFAEWQAITFAGHLLVPAYVVQKFDDANILAAATNAPDKIIRERMCAVRTIKKVLKPIYEGDMCVKCTHFTLVREGCATRCDTCGNRVQF
jgi:hypothetical protein